RHRLAGTAVGAVSHACRIVFAWRVCISSNGKRGAERHLSLRRRRFPQRGPVIPTPWGFTPQWRSLALGARRFLDFFSNNPDVVAMFVCRANDPHPAMNGP